MLDAFLGHDRKDVVERRTRLGIVRGRQPRTPNRIDIKPQIVGQTEPFKIVLFAKLRKVVLNAHALHHATRQQHAMRAERRLDENLNIFAHGIVEPSHDARMTLPCICQVRHIGLENHRASPRQRRRLRHILAQTTRLFDRHSKSLDELHQKVPSPLATTRILAVNFVRLVAQFQHRKPMRPNRNDRRRLIVDQKPKSLGARQFIGDLHHLKHAPKPPTDAYRIDRLVRHRREHATQCRLWVFVVGNALFRGDRTLAVFVAQLDDFERFCAYVDADIPFCHCHAFCYRNPLPQGLAFGHQS